jgi:beta-glucuronidase
MGKAPFAAWSARLLRAVACALLAAAVAAVAAPEPAAPPIPTPALVAADLRPGQDLSGSWHYSVDPYRSGLSGFHGGEPGRSEQRFAEVDVTAALRADSRALFEFDMDSAPRATLPGSWLTHAPEMRHYQGLVWYQRHFPARRAPNTRLFLRFGAVNYRAQVYLNGKRIGEHEGGFTPFAFDVTGAVRDGDNQLTVAVDSAATDESVPPPVTDWENYGGITRAVRLIEVPETFVDDAWVRLTRDGRIAVDVRLAGSTAGGSTIRLAIPALRLTLTGRTDRAGGWRTTAAAPAALQRWSPARPTLYDVEVTAGADRWRDRVGFRTIERRGSQILVNGRPTFLRGISVHEEEIGANPARIITPAAARALLTEAKQGLNANYVRLAHYPHAEITTRIADELGLLVWSEIPVYWRVAWSSPAALRTARDMLAANVVRDRNRASIAIWSIANETPVGPERNAFLSRLAGDVRALDDTRLVAAALLTRREQQDGHPVMSLDDPLAAMIDVIGINTYAGWYGGDRLADVPRIAWRLPPDKPVLFSEFGAGAEAGVHDERAEPYKFSEEYQRDYYRATLAMADGVPTLAGMSPWILKDFRSPRRQNGFQRGWNRKGLISETGKRKLAHAVLADYYTRRATQTAQAD